ncbi:unnamed protein product [Vicia faba]|uniref:Uncharacterized protein n=1 Tax=Vicia faba TaxID=3906 RepID=A0AAV0ZZ67_VICFA|nr:unnamed protein product [Vicia faba]
MARQPENHQSSEPGWVVQQQLIPRDKMRIHQRQITAPHAKGTLRKQIIPETGIRLNEGPLNYERLFSSICPTEGTKNAKVQCSEWQCRVIEFVHESLGDSIFLFFISEEFYSLIIKLFHLLLTLSFLILKRG